MNTDDKNAAENAIPERKKLCSVIIDTYIHDVELSAKLKEKLQKLNISASPDKIYSVNVSFDTGAYKDINFYKFPVERPQWAIEKFEKLDAEEKQKTIIYGVLDAQLTNVCKALDSLNIKYKYARISGDNFENIRHVELDITEAGQSEPPAVNSKKSKKQEKITTVFSIIPDSPYILNRAAEFLADYIIRKNKEENIKKLEKSMHEPNLISARKIFTALANAIIQEFPDRYSSAEDLSKKLLQQARLKNDWPLEIVYDDGISANNNTIEADSEIDCPEYLIYIKKRHSWTLQKVQDSESAKRTILFSGYNQKYVDQIIVLHNLEHIRFNLFIADNGEIKPISKDEAHTAKKLYLSWCNK